MTSNEHLEHFKEISGCNDYNEALHYLKAGQGNLEHAINLYFSHKSRKKQKTDPTAPSTSKQPVAENVSVVDLSDEEARSQKNTRKKMYDSDVRPPIAPVQGAIVEQTFRQTYGGMKKGSFNPIFEQYHDFRQIAEEQDACLRQKLTQKVAFSDNNAEKICSKNVMKQLLPSNNSTNLDPGEAESSSKDLKSLFRPPVEITFKEDWDMTLAEARNNSTWLLINVQMATEFACQILNRDIWSKSTVREIIQSNFLFWQVYHDSPDGIRVCSYYDIHQFPAIFVVDPRTGEEVLKLRAQDSVSFLDQVTAFLEKCPTFCARDVEISRMPNIPQEDARRRRKQRCGIAIYDSEESDCFSVQAKRMKRVVNINDDEDSNMVDDTRESHFPQQTGINDWQNYIVEDIGSINVEMLLRFPDGSKESIVMPNATCLKALFVFIAGKGLSITEYQVVLNFPKRIFTIYDQQKTLREIEFAKQEVIHIEKI